MSVSRFVLLALLALVLTVPGWSTTIILTMDPNIGNYHHYDYTDADGSSHGEYTGPYPATLSGGGYGSGVRVFVNCFDINVNVYTGASYNGYMMLPESPTDLAAAYLEKKMFEAGTYNAPTSVTGPLAMAIWQLENPSSVNPAPFPFDAAAAPLVTEALNAVATRAWTAADAVYYTMWIPTPLGSAQRFGLVLGPEPSPHDLVPEPESVLLIVGGLVMLIGARFAKARTARG